MPREPTCCAHVSPTGAHASTTVHAEARRPDSSPRKGWAAAAWGQHCGLTLGGFPPRTARRRAAQTTPPWPPPRGGGSAATGRSRTKARSEAYSSTSMASERSAARLETTLVVTVRAHERARSSLSFKSRRRSAHVCVCVLCASSKRGCSHAHGPRRARTAAQWQRRPSAPAQRIGHGAGSTPNASRCAMPAAAIGATVAAGAPRRTVAVAAAVAAKLFGAARPPPVAVLGRCAVAADASMDARLGPPLRQRGRSPHVRHRGGTQHNTSGNGGGRRRPPIPTCGNTGAPRSWTPKTAGQMAHTRRVP